MERKPPDRAARFGAREYPIRPLVLRLLRTLFDPDILSGWKYLFN
ncbi:MAG: hypothetical protein AAGU26_08755 [bacterium]